MKWFALFSMILTCGCATTMEDLDPPSKESYFETNHDLTAVEILGYLEIKWVVGLKAGKYILAGEDSKGYYYLSEDNNGGYFQLSEENAEDYLEDNEFESFKGQGNFQNMYDVPGGLWVPKPQTEKRPKLFYFLKTPGRDASVDAGTAIGAANARSAGVGDVAGGFVGGLTAELIMKAYNGSLAYRKFETIPEFIGDIEFHE